ncbi:MAG TPA: Flp pilus assembly protein CpaB [Anaerolineae bacterium]|nr:Flp pilus assembly protein CpaB [Anaerolineae bacterium]
MQRGRLLIILGIILGLATIGAVAFLLLSGGGGLPAIGGSTPEPPQVQQAQEEGGIPTTQVIVALQPIPRGSEFVAGSIGRRDWPANNVPPDVIADEAETIGKVARTEIVQGQVIVRSMLVDVGVEGEASLVVPPGRVAVAYPIDSQSSVSYAIQPGDSVDILITAYFVDVDEEFQTPLPNKTRFFFPVFDEETGAQVGLQLSETIDEGRFELGAGDVASVVVPSTTQIPRRVAQLTVQSAKVLRVGPWIELPGPPAPEDGSPPPPPPPPDVATLAVTPQDALVLYWIRENGINSEMALRAAGEDEADHLTEAVTLQYMLTRFNIAVPPKIEFIMIPSIFDLFEQADQLGTELQELEEVGN